MDPHSGGNIIPEVTREEHDHATYSKRVNIVASNATIYAVVNTSAAGVGQSMVTLNAGPNQIGSVTVSNPISILGNVTLSDPKGFIGLSTVVIGSPIPTGTNFIGFATVAIGSGGAGDGAILDGVDAGLKANVLSTASGRALLTYPLSGPTIYAVVNTGAAGVGNSIVTVANTPLQVQVIGNVTLSDPKGFIGLATVVQSNSTRSIAGNLTLSDSKGFIGLVSIGGGLVGISGNVTLSDPKGFIGLVTGINLNAGTTKTIVSLPIALSTDSLATIAVPTGGNAIFKATNLLVSSNATVRINIKSGVTYLTGNASLGVNLFPGGGWVETSSPDSPIYLGLASGAALVVEKADSGGLLAQIGGKVSYFSE